MSNVRIKQHPTLGILVCTDGHVMVPANYRSKAHWTLGCNTKEGYRTLHIGKHTYRIHRLVAETFLANPENKPEIDHINRIPSDNRVENLRGATRSDNNRNTRSNDRCEKNIGVHLYDNPTQYYRIHVKIYKATPQGIAAQRRYYKKRCNTRRLVRFQDGKGVWLPNDEAIQYLKIPLKNRRVPERILKLRASRVAV